MKDQIENNNGRTTSGTVLLLALLYFLLAKVGLSLPVLGGNISLVWPAAGLGTAMTFLLGPSAALGIWLGATVATATTHVPLVSSVMAGVANAAAALLFASFLHWFGFKSLLRTVGDTAIFLVIGVLFAPLASSVIGVTGFYLAEIRALEGAFWVLFRWWLGDAFGILLVAPVILTTLDESIPPLSARRRNEFVLTALIQSSLLALGFSTSLQESSHIPLMGYLVFPFLIWCSLRYTLREATVVSFLAAVIAVVGTAKGYGPFAPLGEVHIVALALYSMALATMALFLATLRRQMLELFQASGKVPAVENATLHPPP